MRSFRSTSGGYGRRLLFEEREFDEIATQELRSAGCLPSAPEAIRIDRFVERRFGCTVEYQDMGEDVLGATLFNNDGSVRGVVVALHLETETADRLFRSTVAHEAGHGLLHSSLFIVDPAQADFRIDNADFKSGRIMCRSGDVKPGQGRGYDGRWWEYQANRMIGSLLLPRPLVMLAVKELLEKTSITNSPNLPAQRRDRAIAAIANVFQVNPVVSQIRLDEILPQNSGQMEF